ncbi:unnamed protein product [Blepharisma stoltei]|uniref:FHA domain-containing protein n=1 Tax=Blepharisma stoltei TaxID=1481888 RepID=A0AAU9JUJ5_9CILI|nr:unnamed protein product [Blepharisma stoltei]
MMMIHRENLDFLNLSIDEAKEQNKATLTAIKQSIGIPDTPGKWNSPARLEKLLSVAKQGKLLRLKVKSSLILPRNSVINITPLKYELSGRTSSDGVTYFGCKKKDRHKGKIVCDFIIPYNDKQLNNSLRNPHFMIHYNPFADSYYIRDLGIGSGVYAKIDYTLALLRRQYIVNFGESHLLISVIPSNPYPRLCLKVYGGKSAGELMFFEAHEYHVNQVFIGRDRDCNVCIDDALISKKQATVFYSQIKGWMLVDGDLQTQRPSTNGTWLYLNEDVELRDGMEIKAFQTLFQVNIY